MQTCVMVLFWLRTDMILQLAIVAGRGRMLISAETLSFTPAWPTNRRLNGFGWAALIPVSR